MRVAVGKLRGVESVDVTLKRGVAHIRLAAGNRVTLAQVRQIIKEAGYTSREATVAVLGRIERSGGTSILLVSGTGERFRLEQAAGAPAVLNGAGRPGSTVEITGTVPQPGAGETTLRVDAIRTPGS